MKYAKLIIRLFLGILFVYSSINKLSDSQSFATAIENYQIFGTYWSHLGAVFIPALEFIIGCMLIFGFWLTEALVLTVILFAVFDLMILQAYVRGLDVACGCFNPTSSSPIDVWKLAENFIFTTLAVFGLILHLREDKTSNQDPDVKQH